MKKIKYTLRQRVGQSNNKEADIEALVDFCSEAKVDEVMLVLGTLEHCTVDEMKAPVEFSKRLKKALAVRDIGISLNPLTTIGQGGNAVFRKTDFRLMRDYDGNQGEIAVCPYCEKWREDISRLWKYYAKELEPDRIYIEDDFRLHNHRPLIWGGCFCDFHMGLYQNEAGVALDPKSFYEAVISVEENDFTKKCRNAYFDVARRTMNDTADFFGKLFKSCNTKAGIMTNDPRLSTVEARDWTGILKRLYVTDLPSVRLHTGSYVQSSPQSNMWDFVQKGMLGAVLSNGFASAEIEIENCPHSVFSQSINFTRFQMETAESIMPDAFTLWLFEGAAPNLKDETEAPKYARMLSSLKPYLQAIRNEGLNVSDLKGLSIGFDPDCVKNIKSNGVCIGLNQLYPSDCMWGSYLSMHGFAARYKLDDMFEDDIIFAGGNYLAGKSNEDISDIILKRKTIIDSDAVKLLIERGLGYLLNIESFKIIKCNIRERVWDVPEVLKNKKTASNIPFVGDGFIKIETSAPKIVYSKYFNSLGEELGDALFRINDTLIFSRKIGFLNPNSLFDPIAYDGLNLRHIRRELLQYAFGELGRVDFVYNAAIFIMKYSNNHADYFFLINYIDDESDKISLNLCCEYSHFEAIDRLNPFWRIIPFTKTGNRIELDLYLQPESSAFIKAYKKNFGK